jgi:hypothetical protein
MLGSKKPKKIRLSDLCYTSEKDMDRIIDSAPVPPAPVKRPAKRRRT